MCVINRVSFRNIQSSSFLSLLFYKVIMNKYIIFNWTLFFLIASFFAIVHSKPTLMEDGSIEKRGEETMRDRIDDHPTPTRTLSHTRSATSIPTGTYTSSTESNHGYQNTSITAFTPDWFSKSIKSFFLFWLIFLNRRSVWK